MSAEAIFPPLTDFEPTRQTLQLYSRVLGVVPRTHAEPHPRWWHISLKVQPYGLATDKIALPDGGTFRLKMDLLRHKLILSKNMQDQEEFSMTEGLTATQMADRVLDSVEDLGITGDYDRDKCDNDLPRQYNPATVPNFLTALQNADRIFKIHREELSGEVTPVQLWPHGFDLAFEWFGSRVETYEEDGETKEYPSQLNLGFYPGDTGDAYFYSNPWPFEADQLLGKSLPPGASWHTEGWQGTILPYEALVNDSNAEARLLEYARAVYDLSAPTLMA